MKSLEREAGEEHQRHRRGLTNGTILRSMEGRELQGGGEEETTRHLEKRKRFSEEFSAAPLSGRVE